MIIELTEDQVDVVVTVSLLEQLESMCVDAYHSLSAEEVKAFGIVLKYYTSSRVGGHKNIDSLVDKAQKRLVEYHPSDDNV